MPNWKELLANRERRQFPEVVVPLAHGSAPKINDSQDNDSSSGLDRTSSQEKGTAGTRVSSTLTLEALRAEVEADINASGHDTAYDRTFLWPPGLVLSIQNWHFLIAYLDYPCWI
jgi:hypothetical protein